jgi:UPF0176 protein
MVSVLDTGILGRLVHRDWRVRAKVSDFLRIYPDASVVIPEICDYEIRRELVRLDLVSSLARLDLLGQTWQYDSLKTEHMRRACEIWAYCRKHGFPFAVDAVLDGDCTFSCTSRRLRVWRCCPNYKRDRYRALCGRGSNPLEPIRAAEQRRYPQHMEDSATWFITSFYRFVPIDEALLPSWRTSINQFLAERNVKGLVLLAAEGINGTVAGASEGIEEFKSWLQLSFGSIRFKDSQCDVRPFKRRTVDIRQEIVGLKRPDLSPETEDNGHLSAQEWHDRLSLNEPAIVIDARNRYETKLGKFKGATDPNLTTFSDWSDYVETADLPRDVPVLIYCTGGIRCEKAALAMREEGFEKVYQLRDGILGYLAEYPEGFFEGECFVFDDRVSLGPDLKPSGNYGICPGCGLTSGAKRTCEWCGASYFVCADCEAARHPVCSKTCLDRYGRHGSANQPQERVSTLVQTV